MSDVTAGLGQRGGHNRLKRHPTIDFTPDDDEFEFVEEDDDDVERKNRKLRRRSSLRTIQSDRHKSPVQDQAAPGSPSSKKV